PNSTLRQRAAHLFENERRLNGASRAILKGAAAPGCGLGRGVLTPMRLSALLFMAISLAAPARAQQTPASAPADTDQTEQGHARVQPYAAFNQGELLTILVENLVGRYLAGKTGEAISKAERARAEAQAKEEVRTAVAEYCNAQPNGGIGLQICSSLGR